MEVVETGYKMTEVGMIPEDWTILRIGELYWFKNGLNKASEYFGYGTPIVNYMDVFNNYGIKAKDVKGKVFVNSDEKHNFSARKGDVFFTRTSETVDEIGISAVLEEEIEDCVFSGFILRARPVKDTISIGYAKYCFLSQIIRSQIISKASYTTRALTNGRHLSQVKLPLPPTLTEQKAIATALSDVDALISILDKLIEKKKAIKQGAMQELLTGKTRMAGFGNGVGYKMTEVGRIPSDWTVFTLGELSESIIGGGTPSRSNPLYWGKELPWVTVKDFATFKSDQTQDYITYEGLKNSSSNLIRKGTLITSTRMALGKAVIYDVDVCINQDLKAIFFKLKADTLFMYYWFQFYSKQIEELGSGSTVMGISLPDLRRQPVSAPSLQEQKAIATTLSDMDSVIEDLETKRNKYNQIKQGMMQELLTGKTRLI